MEINAQINISAPTILKIAHEPDKHKKHVKIYVPVPEGITRQKTYTGRII